jgi:2-hydroxy-3-oxopropionate reductase
VHVDPSGAGQTRQGRQPAIAAGNLQLVAEAIVLLEAFGVDMVSARRALSGGLAGSAVLEQKAPDMIARARPGRNQ